MVYGNNSTYLRIITNNWHETRFTIDSHCVGGGIAIWLCMCSCSAVNCHIRTIEWNIIRRKFHNFFFSVFIWNRRHQSTKTQSFSKPSQVAICFYYIQDMTPSPWAKRLDRNRELGHGKFWKYLCVRWYIGDTNNRKRMTLLVKKKVAWTIRWNPRAILRLEISLTNRRCSLDWSVVSTCIWTNASHFMKYYQLLLEQNFRRTTMWKKNPQSICDPNRFVWRWKLLCRFWSFFQ